MPKLTPKHVHEILSSVNIIIAFSGAIYMYYSPTNAAKYTISNSATNERWSAFNMDDACKIFNDRVEMQNAPPKEEFN